MFYFWFYYPLDACSKFLIERQKVSGFRFEGGWVEDMLSGYVMWGKSILSKKKGMGWGKPPTGEREK